MLVAIKRPKADKAPGPEGISNQILQAYSNKLSKMLILLFQVCIKHVYHPHAFRTAHTLALKKMGKNKDFTISKGYCPIALLNTLSKTLESIMAKKITYLTEEYKLLPDTQMEGQSGRFTESALELLTEQVHTVWGQRSDKVATLMSMDVAGAFDTISYQHFIHNLQKRKISKWIANWMKSFLTGRRITLSIYRQTITEFHVQTDIPQGFPLSLILYLFYNVDLLEICNRSGTNTSAIGFIDDVNILAYSTSTEENCKTLKRLHKKCKRWALKYSSVFASDKYKLIYLKGAWGVAEIVMGRSQDHWYIPTI